MDKNLAAPRVESRKCACGTSNNANNDNCVGCGREL